MDMSTVIDGLKNYGLPGVMLLLVITGYLVPKAVYTREVARADKAEALNESLTALLERSMQR